MTIELTWRVVAALAALLLISVAVHGYHRTGLTRDSVVAAGRAVLQLTAAALVIAGAAQRMWSSVVVVVAMFVMAVVTSCRRAAVPWRRMPFAAGAIACGVLPVLTVLLASGALPWTGLAIIPVSGILLGGAMTAHTLYARRAFAVLRDEHAGYTALLSLGLPPREAVAELTYRYVPEGLVAGLDQIRTAGVVTLPGAFIGVLLGGGSPAQAATVQLLVLFGLLAAQSISVVIESRLVAGRRLLPTDLQASLID